MENHLLKRLHSLQYTKFINCLGKGNNLSVNLAFHGKKYQDELLKLWKKTKNERNIEKIIIRENKNIAEDVNQLEDIAFLGNNYFQKYSQKYQELRELTKFTTPPILTIKSLITLNESKFQTFLNWDKTAKETLLITDHFLNVDQCLENFYSLQRKRKIWWMRYSANPSRYSLDAKFNDQNLPTNEESAQQVVVLKSNFSNGLSIDMELLMVLIDRLNKSYHKNQLCIIRSVIPLEKATCALLLDATEHNRPNLLRLNRKLAPYQCYLAIEPKNSNLPLFNVDKQQDLNDLHTHLMFVLKRAGLRVYDPGNLPEDITLYRNKSGQQDSLAVADGLGIPYNILIDENESLKTGFLKLRSRETTLSEIIHISDIPNYLLKIFHN